MAGKRFPLSDLLPYVMAQVIGGIAGAGVLYIIASGKPGFDLSGGFAANGYAAHSPGSYSLGACLAAEIVLTLFFVLIIMGATDRRAPTGFAPIAIGLGLTLIHLIGIPVTNLSVNPAGVLDQPWSSEDGQSDNFGCSGWPPLSADQLAERCTPGSLSHNRQCQRRQYL